MEELTSDELTSQEVSEAIENRVDEIIDFLGSLTSFERQVAVDFLAVFNTPNSPTEAQASILRIAMSRIDGVVSFKDRLFDIYKARWFEGEAIGPSLYNEIKKIEERYQEFLKHFEAED